MTSSERVQIALLAELLDYPGPGLAEKACACRDVLERDMLGAAEVLDAFIAGLDSVSPQRLEELYSATFDLDATCCPYVGHYLFGESYRRSRFMTGLLERYRAHGFEGAGELPDHLVVMLRFLAFCDDEELASELVDDALLPALAQMTGKGASSDNLYLRVLEAARLALAELRSPQLEPAGATS